MSRGLPAIDRAYALHGAASRTAASSTRWRKAERLVLTAAVRTTAPRKADLPAAHTSRCELLWTLRVKPSRGCDDTIQLLPVHPVSYKETPERIRPTQGIRKEVVGIGEGYGPGDGGNRDLAEGAARASDCGSGTAGCRADLHRHAAQPRPCRQLKARSSVWK